MKNLLFILLAAALSFGACKKDPNNSERTTGLCPVSDTVRAIYTESAMQLLMQRYMNDTTLSGYHSATFSASELDEMLGYIQSVYDLKIPERDSVFNVYQIREYPVVSLNGVNLKVDPTAPEIQRLLAGNSSGNPQLDALLTHYGIDSFNAAYSYPAFSWIWARAATPHNMIQIAKELRAFPFIYIAEADGYMGDGDRIKVTAHIAGGFITVVDFSIGREDCPAGCIYRRHWEFQIGGNCTASFIRSYE